MESQGLYQSRAAVSEKVINEDNGIGQLTEGSMDANANNGKSSELGFVLSTGEERNFKNDESMTPFESNFEKPGFEGSHNVNTQMEVSRDLETGIDENAKPVVSDISFLQEDQKPSENVIMSNNVEGVQNEEYVLASKDFLGSEESVQTEEKHSCPQYADLEHLHTVSGQNCGLGQTSIQALHDGKSDTIDIHQGSFRKCSEYISLYSVNSTVASVVVEEKECLQEFVEPTGKNQDVSVVVNESQLAEEFKKVGDAGTLETESSKGPERELAYSANGTKVNAVLMQDAGAEVNMKGENVGQAPMLGATPDVSPQMIECREPSDALQKMEIDDSFVLKEGKPTKDLKSGDAVSLEPESSELLAQESANSAHEMLTKVNASLMQDPRTEENMNGLGEGRLGAISEVSLQMIECREPPDGIQKMYVDDSLVWDEGNPAEELKSGDSLAVDKGNPTEELKSDDAITMQPESSEVPAQESAKSEVPTQELAKSTDEVITEVNAGVVQDPGIQENMNGESRGGGPALEIPPALESFPEASPQLIKREEPQEDIQKMDLDDSTVKGGSTSCHFLGSPSCLAEENSMLEQEAPFAEEHGILERKTETENDLLTPQSSSKKTKGRRSSNKFSFGKSSAGTIDHYVGDFSVGDLVWGKVRSHPWWPGLIFDPSDASEQANKHCMKDRFLVAFLGDGTFGWCDKSQLVPFYSYFGDYSKQKNTKAFLRAIRSALNEVARRVELGLMCSCFPEEYQKEVETRAIENSGIREGAVINDHPDVTQAISKFDPLVFLSDLYRLAVSPTSSFGLQTSVLCAQATAIIAFKGILMSGKLSAEHFESELLALELDISSPRSQEHRRESLTSEGKKSRTRKVDSDKSGGSAKKNPEASRTRRTKKRSIEELIGKSDPSQQEREENSETLMDLARNKRDRMFEDQNKAGEMDTLPAQELVEAETKFDWLRECLNSQLKETIVEGSSGKHKTPMKSKKMKDIRMLSSANVDETPNVSKVSKEPTEVTPENKEVEKSTRKSMGLGDCIRKVASQLTPVSSSSRKRRSIKSLRERRSAAELLSDLLIVAQEPLFWAGKLKKSPDLVNYFLEFRNSTFEKSSTKHGTPKVSGQSTKVKASQSPVDTSDTACREKHRRRYKRKAESPLEDVQGRRKRAKQSSSPRPRQSMKNTKRKLKEQLEEEPVRQYSRRTMVSQSPNNTVSPMDNNIDEKPATLFMRFPGDYALPSENELKAKFARFGSLDLSETKVFRSSGCAQVAFKRSSAAEAAFNYASDNFIFSTAKVSFRLRYPSAKNSTLSGEQQDLGKQERHSENKDKQILTHNDKIRGTDNNTEDLSQPSTSLSLYKPESTGESQLLLIQHNLEMMTSMLSQSTDASTSTTAHSSRVPPEAKADIMDEMMSLLQKVTALVSQQS
eukprot:TRINITY_DN640_c0_g1_i1.p1 TRINITY_DN640_c0_g1~~TRINITY_DN640_c0_g1_i1.p1  ORF type:complete len:1410 (+),score=378.51 TRINITY_DN640_c0_g1_i1:436-4665(+)